MSRDTIRGSIEALRQATESAAGHFREAPGLDEDTRGLWVSDSKELYLKFVAAWQLLNSGDPGGDSSAARLFLEGAEGSFEQVSSELRSIGGLAARETTEALRRAFESCWNEIDLELTSTDARGSRVGAGELLLPCSVCGETAARWRIGVPAHERSPHLLYEGVAGAAALPESEAGRVLAWLRAGDLKSAHSHARGYLSMEEGIDAYCPDCDKIFCRRHYNVTEEWDEGFYDCAWGTCPGGHKRVIHD